MKKLISWRKSELRAFIRALDTSFNGIVVWMTLSKFIQQLNTAEECPFKLMHGNERFQELDSQLVPIILQETNWTIYDGYHVTEPLAYMKNAKDYFTDRIHHPGRLTHLGWQFILGHVCPHAPPVPNL